MKGCDGCGECCHLLEVSDIAKPAFHWCPQARHGANGAKSCGVHEKKPAACVAFHCLWLMSQLRPNQSDALPDALRPDRCHVIFYRNGTERDPRVIFAEVDPKFPQAWQSEVVMNQVNALTLRGAIVIVQIAGIRIIFQKGQPVVKTDVVTAEALAGKVVDLDKVRMGSRLVH